MEKTFNDEEITIKQEYDPLFCEESELWNSNINSKLIKNELSKNISSSPDSVSTGSSECVILEPEAVYIKEEVSDDSNVKSYAESEDKPSVSDQSDKKYSSPSHMRTRTQEKSYACDICGKLFRKSSSVTVHKRTHTKEKPYACKICEKQFSQSASVTTHMRTHTKEKPYRCEVCGKMFTQLGSVTAHLRIHTQEKPYACQLCEKMYSDKSSLNNHMRSHGKEKK